MPQGISESAIEKRLVKRILTNLGVSSIKLNLQGNRGWPDRLFLLPLRPAWCELKREGEKPRKLQEQRMLELRYLGYDVLWTDNEDTAYKWIKDLHSARLSEAGHQNHDIPSLCRVILRSRAWEDINQSSGK
jgi:hypothetical protein